MSDSGIGIMAIIILGCFILMAAAVIADPGIGDEAWDFAMGVFKMACAAVIVIAIILAIIIIIMVVAG
jgi:hypothetical protein